MVIKSLRFQNPKIVMDNWMVIKEEEPQVKSQPFLFGINAGRWRTIYGPKSVR